MTPGTVGARFGRYRIERQLGSGGMGVVHLATDTELNRTVALKVMWPQLASDTSFRERFAHEAATLARVDSAHIVSIFDHGVHDDTVYITTQYVDGGDLGALLRSRGPLPPQLAARICAQVADALFDAHRAGVVHRDVKPANVLLRSADSTEPHVYLCDFGIARTGDSLGLTVTGAVAGTWAWLAPERSQGSPGTPASDIYSLGCLLWACLNGGASPFTGTDIDVAQAHL
ncbi:serine/threonine-protein kinase, partial [Nocardioides jensenii]|uniref:serine/threonine-protein kinase n=1 Tax=Nocardioides jensenii TaxID=1843 RepID=UPI000A9D0914